MNDSGPYYRPPGMGGRPRPSRIRWLPIVIGLVFVAAATVILLILLYPASFGLAPSSYPYRVGLFGGFFLFFFILIVAFFIVRVLWWSTRASRYGRPYGSGGPGEYGPNRPAMVARMRYARGEISREQYDQIMQDLARRPGAP
jgi:uncharacterized membrane protein